MDIVKHRFKEVNGRILKILESHGFDYISDRVVEDYFKELKIKCTLRSVQDHLLYLAGKGKEYVEVKKSNVEEKEMLTRLTPRGVDLLYGVIDDDPGISIHTKS